MSRPLVPVPILVLAALWLTACSEPAPEPPPAPMAVPPPMVEALGPCELLTAQEIVAVVGIEPGEPIDPGPSGPMSQCTWPAADGSQPQLVHLLILPRLAPDLETFLAQARESLGDQTDNWTLEPVEGLGDFAVVMGPEGFPVLQVVEGMGMLQVKTVATEERDAVENEKLIAELILERLAAAAPSAAPTDPEAGEAAAEPAAAPSEGGSQGPDD